MARPHASAPTNLRRCIIELSRQRTGSECVFWRSFIPPRQGQLWPFLFKNSTAARYQTPQADLELHENAPGVHWHASAKGNAALHDSCNADVLSCSMESFTHSRPRGQI